MAKKNQSGRLTREKKATGGEIGIFCDLAKGHDTLVSQVSKEVCSYLLKTYPGLHIRYLPSITKAEINKKLKQIDENLGNVLFVSNASIKPDGGLVEVQDKNGNWRVLLVSEAKYQGRDIENILEGKLVGKYDNQDLMVAGNAIERAHKNIAEIANYMLDEQYFPYVLFLEGSNFLTESLSIRRPDGRNVILDHTSGGLNRLDRLTAANYGLPLNTNLCKNRVISIDGKERMLQATSIYTQGDGSHWDRKAMFEVMKEVALTSLSILRSEGAFDA